MSPAGTQSGTRTSRSARARDMQDARPLLQAICLGVFLAAVLTAAAALAGPDTQTKASSTAPATKAQQVPHPAAR